MVILAKQRKIILQKNFRNQLVGKADIMAIWVAEVFQLDVDRKLPQFVFFYPQAPLPHNSFHTPSEEKQHWKG